MEDMLEVGPVEVVLEDGVVVTTTYVVVLAEGTGQAVLASTVAVCVTMKLDVCEQYCVVPLVTPHEVSRTDAVCVFGQDA
jgi:hypothetical protein